MRRGDLQRVGMMLAGWLSIAAPVGAETVNRIVAVVNDEVITRADVMFQVNAMFEDLDQPLPTGDQQAQIGTAILFQLIEQQLVLQEAKRAGISVDQEQVAERLARIKSGFESETEFQASLMSAGVSEERLRRHIREQLLISKAIRERIWSTIVVSPQELNEELEAVQDEGDQVWLSHLLVRVDETRTEPEALALIEQIRARIKEGEQFADLARTYSEDPQAKAGGDLGWLGAQTLPPELQAVLPTLREGDCSAPIQTQFGFHLLQLEGRRAAPPRTGPEAKQAAHERIAQRKFKDVYARWLTELKDRAYIQLFTAS